MSFDLEWSLYKAGMKHLARRRLGVMIFVWLCINMVKHSIKENPVAHSVHKWHENKIYPRDFYAGEGCQMLKDFKNRSHVFCSDDISKLANDSISVEKLKSQTTRLKNNVMMKRKRHRRHLLAPPPMDMRDFLDGDKYHRYDTIAHYLEVVYPFFTSLVLQIEVFYLNSILSVYPWVIPMKCWIWIIQQ